MSKRCLPASRPLSAASAAGRPLRTARAGAPRYTGEAFECFWKFLLLRTAAVVHRVGDRMLALDDDDDDDAPAAPSRGGAAPSRGSDRDASEEESEEDSEESDYDWQAEERKGQDGDSGDDYPYLPTSDEESGEDEEEADEATRPVERMLTGWVVRPTPEIVSECYLPGMPQGVLR